MFLFVCFFVGFFVCFFWLVDLVFCFLVASSWLTSNQVLVKGNGMNSKLKREAGYLPISEDSF